YHGHKQNFKKGGFQSQQRPERKQDKFTLLTKTPKEIFALDKGKFKPPSPMTTLVEKRNARKFCEFYEEVGHTTDEFMHLKRQIEEMIKAGKLSHLIKELKKRSRKDQANAAKKGETSGKDKSLVVLMVQPWQRVARQKVTQTFSLESVISFPPMGEEDGTEGPMIIETEMGGHCFHRMEAMGKVNPGSSIYSPWNAKIPSNRRNGHATEQQDYSTRMHNGFGARVPQPVINQVTKEKIQVAIHPEYPEQTIVIGPTMFTVKQKKRGQARERNKAICEEVEKLVDADIMKEVHYHSWLSNPVMCVDFKDLNKVCPKDGYPLPKIDWKVKSLCGYPLKCFLDAYKGYHQIKMAEEDEEKTTFITSQGIFCYSKMPFGLKNAGATYQRLMDKAFQKQIGQNLEVYVDDLLIKIHTEKEVIKDIEETFKTLREINMKLNPKKCAFGMREGTFLRYKVDADGLRVFMDKVEAVFNLPSPKCLKDVQKLNGKLASLNRFLSKSTEKSLPFFKILKKCTKKSEFEWTTEAKMEFKQRKKLIADLPMDGKQTPIYFVSRVLQGPEVNYTLMKKLILALMLSNLEVAGRLLKWRFELEEHDIHFRPKTSVKGHILVDFIVELSKDDPLDTPIEDKEELLNPAEEVILVEIGMQTLRITEVDMIKNNEALGINLDLLEEKREQAAIQEAKSKVKMEKYYNARVRNTSFRPGDLVYQNNEASRAEDRGKLKPKWEGPYEVLEALGKGAYKLRDHTEIPFREHETSTTLRNVICMKCKHLSHARQSSREGIA
nr:reverse transcriptase domain-containing protein [Tanacetum cinerariifolium]